MNHAELLVLYIAELALMIFGITPSVAIALRRCKNPYAQIDKARKV